MAGYLPLSAFRHGLLPETCRACAWWLSSSKSPHSRADAAVGDWRSWMDSLESTWGSTGWLLEDGGIFTSAISVPASQARSAAQGAPDPAIAAVIHFAPGAAVPRLRDLSFEPQPEDSAFAFCLACAAGQAWFQPKRILHKALARLRDMGVSEVYAVASEDAGLGDPHGRQQPDGERCRFFSPAFLVANGFVVVQESNGLLLMRVDLKGLLTIASRVKAAVRQLLGQEPAPSPAAWTMHADTR